MDDFADLARCAAPPLAQRRRGVRAAGVAPAAPHTAGHDADRFAAAGPHDDDDDGRLVVRRDHDFEAMIAIEAMPIERKHQARSWQLLQHARACKKQKKMEAEATALQARSKQMAGALDLVRFAFPHVGQVVGIKGMSGATDFTEQRAKWNMVLAVKAPLRQSDLRRTQGRSASLVAHAALDTQESYVSAVLEGGGAGVVDDCRSVVKMVSWAWDETSQKAQDVMSVLRPGQKQSKHKVAIQVMMQHGCVRVWDSSDTPGQLTVEQPHFCRSTFLCAQTTDAILEGFLRVFPLGIEDPARMSKITDRDDTEALIIAISTDSARANFAAMQFVWSKLCEPPYSEKIFPHAEPCVLHLVQLVRHRPLSGKGFISAGTSFARFLSQWRSLQAWQAALIDYIEKELVIDEAAPSEEVVRRNDEVKAALIGADDATYLWRRHQDGHLRKSALLCDMDRLCELLVIDSSCLRHHCSVKEGSEEAGLGKPVGSRCCSSAEEAKGKVVALLLNMFSSRAWDQGAASRWTHTGSVMKRILLGFLLGRFFPEVLAALQRFWDAPEGIEGALAAIVSADSAGAFDAKRKLRLIRIAREFRHEQAGWKMAILVTGYKIVDDFMYLVFGSGTDKATLLTLVGFETAAFAKIHGNLLELLTSWGGASPMWPLYRAARGDPRCRDQRVFARSFLMQLDASLFEHMDLRFSQPPYTLLPLLEDTTPMEMKREIAAEFRETPEHCLSLFGRRLRSSHPTDHGLIFGAKAKLRAFVHSVRLSIDHIERSHYHLRLDLKSDGSAKVVTPSANKVFCRQIYHEHRHRFNMKNDDKLIAALPIDLGDKKTTRQEGSGGNGRMCLQNMKMKTFKMTHAATRSMTPTEISEVHRRTEAEWSSLGETERDAWAAVHRAEILQRRSRAHDDTPEGVLVPHDASSVAHRNLWGCDGGPTQVVPTTAIVAQHRRHGKEFRRRLADYDESLMVREPVPERVQGTPDPERRGAPLFACGAGKRNICRAMLTADDQRGLDRYTKRLRAWCDALDDNDKSACRGLLLLRGLVDDGSPEGATDFDMVAMLTLQRRNPIMQVFCRCVLRGNDARRFTLGALPTVVELARAPSRVTRTIVGLDLCTSDELALELQRSGLSWKFFRLNFEELDDENLLGLKVVAIGPELLPKAKAVAKRSVAGSVVDELEGLMGDPMAMGMSAGQRLRDAGPSSASHDEPVADEVADASGYACDEVDEVLDGVPDGFADDVCEDMAEALGINLSDEVAVEDVAAGPANVCEAEAAMSDASAEAEETALRAANDPSGSEAPSPPEPPQWEMNDRGYITSPSMPWASYGVLGRISTWPEKKPMEKRSVSCRCYMHRACTTPARGRAKITDTFLVEWLLSARREAGATPSRSSQLAEEHKRLFHSMFAAHQREEPSTPSLALASSTAASSGS